MSQGSTNVPPNRKPPVLQTKRSGAQLRVEQNITPADMEAHLWKIQTHPQSKLRNCSTLDSRARVSIPDGTRALPFGTHTSPQRHNTFLDSRLVIRSMTASYSKNGDDFLRRRHEDSWPCSSNNGTDSMSKLPLSSWTQYITMWE